MPAPECTSCGQSQRQSKLISCLHTLCITCLERHTMHDGCVKCPNCSRNTPLQAGCSPLLCLPDSYPKESSVCAGGPMEQGQRRSDVAFCDECADEEVATSKCVDCRLNLCDGHGRMHPRSRATRGHSLTAVGASRSSRSKGIASVLPLPSHPPAKRRCTSCAVHPSEALTSFCFQCSQVLCERCSETSMQKHDGHTLLSVQDAATKRRELLRSNLQKPISEDGCSVSGAIEKLQKTIQIIHNRTEASSQDVTDLFSTAAAKLKEREDELLHRLDELRAKKVALLEKQLHRLQSADCGRLSVSSILGSCDDDVDLLRMCEWLDVAVEKAEAAAKNDSKPCTTCVPVFSCRDADDLFAQISKTGAVSDLADATMTVTKADKVLKITIQPQDNQPVELVEERISDLGVEVEVLVHDQKFLKCCPLAVSDAGTLEGEFTVEQNTHHLVSAKVDEVHLQGSPLQLPVEVVAETPVFDASQCHTGLRLSSDNHTVEQADDTRWASVRTVQPLEARPGQPVTWRLRVDQSPPDYCFVCISNVAAPDLNNYNSTGTFGWDGYRAATSYDGRALGHPWQAGDVISLTYDATRRTLTGVHERSGATEVLAVDEGIYYGFVSMWGKSTQLTSLSLTSCSNLLHSGQQTI